MYSLALLLDTASRVEVLFSLMTGVGIYYPLRIAWRTGWTARELWRLWHLQRIAVDRAEYVITFAPTVVIFILAATAASVMGIFCLIGVVGLLSAPGEPNPNNPGNAPFRWALVGGLFAVVILKNVAVYLAYKVYAWGERTFAGEKLEERV